MKYIKKKETNKSLFTNNGKHNQRKTMVSWNQDLKQIILV